MMIATHVCRKDTEIEAFAKQWREAMRGKRVDRVVKRCASTALDPDQ
jgi:hypothetical protein